MKRASSANDTRKPQRAITGSFYDQRLVAASSRALEAHARVRRIAARLSDELDNITSPQGIPVTDLDPGDSMVMAVEKVITTAKPTLTDMTAPTRAQALAETAAPRTPTRLGVAPIAKPSIKG